MVNMLFWICLLALRQLSIRWGCRVHLHPDLAHTVTMAQPSHVEDNEWHCACHLSATTLKSPLYLSDNQRAEKRSPYCEDSLEGVSNGGTGREDGKVLSPTYRGLNGSYWHLMHYSIWDAMPGAISKHREGHECRQWAANRLTETIGRRRSWFG